MNLYLISQTVNWGYDTYDSAVVAAESEEGARNTHPSGLETEESFRLHSTWVQPENVSVKLLGRALEGTEAGVICASFNAG